MTGLKNSLGVYVIAFWHISKFSLKSEIKVNFWSLKQTLLNLSELNLRHCLSKCEAPTHFTKYRSEGLLAKKSYKCSRHKKVYGHQFVGIHYNLM